MSCFFCSCVLKWVEIESDNNKQIAVISMMVLNNMLRMLFCFTVLGIARKSSVSIVNLIDSSLAKTEKSEVKRLA